MTEFEPGVLTFLRLPLAVGLFLVPGWLLGRCLGTPFPAMTTFLGSCALLFNSILILDVLRVPLTAGSVGLVMILAAVLLAHPAWRRPPPAAPAGPPGRIVPAGWEWLWVPPVLAAIASVGLRAVIEPLSGFDNWTRWDYLARLMIAQGSLDHYPPISAQDFEWYPWCDGIPPLVPVLNFWIYTASGAALPVLTAVRVVGEALLIGLTVFRLGRHLWGEAGGWPALAAASSSSLLLWACAMGQETGLTTLALAAVLLFLAQQAQSGAPETGWWIGIAAGVGAISREYGLAMVLFALAVLAMRPSGRPALGRFLLAAGLVAGPWYLRNWILTGNPVFPHSVGGMFPTNPIHTSAMESIAAYWGVGAGFYSPWSIPVVLGILAGPLFLLGIIGLVRSGRRGAALGVAIVMVIALWWWSIPSTAAGWTYAARVLAPALALAGGLAGWIATARAPVRIFLGLFMSPLALDAGRRAWVLPQNPDEPAWPFNTVTWRANHEGMRSIRGLPLWPTLVAAAPGRVILVDHPSHHVEVTLRGGRAAPWFSPAARALFSHELTFDEARTKLQAEGVRFVTVTVGIPSSEWFLRHYPLLGELTTRYTPTARIQYLSIYDLESLVVRAETPRNP